jgi:DNA-binding NtrC family response regulator
MARTDRGSVAITLTDVELAVRLNALLEADGHDTVLVSPFDDLRAEIERARADVVVFTGALAEPSNMQLARELAWQDVAVVGVADVIDPTLNERLRGAGFTTICTRPLPPEELFHSVRRVLDWQRLTRITGLIGQSGAIREVLIKVEQIAPVSSTVLIEGESGTGKELVARAIHRLSPRRNQPFIAVNVGALPETLLESELFGHEKGAFTGAAERRIGRFELADEGTLFLDEIGDIPAATQVKLLRVLEEREITRVGGSMPIRVNVRVVAATNQPLRESVESGAFRSDLYYRLNVLRVYLPPLRERREDIPLLVRRFVREFAKEHDRPFRGISAEVMQLLVDYQWPGNVRELRNLLESMVVLAPDREIGADDIPRQIREGGVARFLPVRIGPVVREAGAAEGREFEFIVRSLVELKLQVEELRRRLDEERVPHPELAGEIASLGYPRIAAVEAPGPPPENVVTIRPGMTMVEIERAAIEAALRETRGNRRRAAELLGIGERTMYRKLREYGLPPAGGEDGFEGVADEGGGARETAGFTARNLSQR